MLSLTGLRLSACKLTYYADPIGCGRRLPLGEKIMIKIKRAEPDILKFTPFHLIFGIVYPNLN